MENEKLNSLKRTMRINIVLYIVYGLFLLIETFDFLEMLHSKPADYSPTYSLVNVIFYQMEMLICFLCAFSLIILVSTRQSVKMLFYISLSLFIFRIGTVYYLYFSAIRWIRGMPVGQRLHWLPSPLHRQLRQGLFDREHRTDR